MTTHRASPRRLHRERGVALMLALWVIVVLSVVAAGVLSASRAQTDLAGTVRARAVARYAAESGVVTARTRLQDLYRQSTTPAELSLSFQRLEAELATSEPQHLGPARFQLAATDLGARIDLNHASDDVVRRLLDEVLGPREASRIMDALRARVDEEGDPIPIRRLDDLTRIAAFDDAALDALAPFVTVRGDGRVNVNTAPPQVLAALPGVGRDGASAIVAAREREGMLASRLAVAPYAAAGRESVGGAFESVAAEPSRILVVSRGWMDGHPLTHEIQVVFEIVRGFLDTPARLRIVHWIERDL